MEIKRTNQSDLSEILKIYESARKYMAENANPNQWTNGYPDEKVILADIEKNNHYTIKDGSSLLGCFSLINGEDPTYKVIEKGQWLDDKPYAVIHRIAVLDHNKGIGSICIDWCFNQFNNIRVDTHPDNISMKRLLLKKGFQHCGVIYNSWGAERLAFHKN